MLCLFWGQLKGNSPGSVPKDAWRCKLNTHVNPLQGSCITLLEGLALNSLIDGVVYLFSEYTVLWTVNTVCKQMSAIEYLGDLIMFVLKF